MKQSYLFVFAFCLLIGFTACEKQTLRTALEPVPECMDLDFSRDNVLDRYEEEMGTLREMSFWAPAEVDPLTQKEGKPIEYTLWVILPDAHPDLILEPCNLPEAQLIPNRRISFSGSSLVYNPYVSNLEGVTPFNLTEISDGVSGPDTEADGC